MPPPQIAVVGVQTLRAWDAGVAAESMGLWETALAELASHWEGVVAGLQDGKALLAFREPVSVAGGRRGGRGQRERCQGFCSCLAVRGPVGARAAAAHQLQVVGGKTRVLFQGLGFKDLRVGVP